MRMFLSDRMPTASRKDRLVFRRLVDLEDLLVEIGGTGVAKSDSEGSAHAASVPVTGITGRV